VDKAHFINTLKRVKKYSSTLGMEEWQLSFSSLPISSINNKLLILLLYSPYLKLSMYKDSIRISVEDTYQNCNEIQSKELPNNPKAINLIYNNYFKCHPKSSWNTILIGFSADKLHYTYNLDNSDELLSIDSILNSINKFVSVYSLKSI